MNILIAILALALGQDYPDHVGVVNDFANEIDKDTKAKIEKAIEDVKTKADIRLVVVTIPSLQGQTVEAYTVGLARKWGVGQKGKNNGILFLHAPKERKIRIENGYGVESRLTDYESKMIIEKMIPLMKANKFSEAMLLGTQEIDRVVTAPEKEPEKQSIQMATKPSEGGDSFAFMLMIVGIVAVVLILILVMVHSARPPPRERYVYSAPPKPPSPLLETDPLRNSAMGIEGLTTAAMLGMVAASQSVPPSTPLPPPTAPVAPDPTLAMMLLEEQRRHREEEERRRKRRREEEEEEDRSRRRRSDDSSSSSSSSWDSGSSSSSSDSFSGGDFGGGGASGDY